MMGIHLTQVTQHIASAAVDYPRTPGEFEARCATEKACRPFLVEARWSEGFRCPRCGAAPAWPVRTVLWQCAAFGRQTSVTAGTIFQDTRTPLSTWFRARCCVTSNDSVWWSTRSVKVLQLIELMRFTTIRLREHPCRH